MEASFWTTMESHPQQAPLGIINMLISRRTLIDSISRSLEVLYEMPYTTEFPPGLPPDLEQLLRDLHASTERLMDEVTRTNRLLHRLAMFPPHALPTQPWLPDGYYLNSLRPMVRLHPHPGLHRLPRSHLGPPDALLPFSISACSRSKTRGFKLCCGFCSV